ncbi:MAG: radical SAM protein, partial [Chloroflexota bacterium]
MKKEVIPDISITVSGQSCQGLPKLIDWILKRNLPFSLNFYRENDFSALHQDLQLEEEKLITNIIAAFKVIEAQLPRQSLLASLVDRANLSTPHLKTCSVGNDYLVFDYLGQVSKCQMNINAPVTTSQADDP